jgi:hypothetical protein
MLYLSAGDNTVPSHRRTWIAPLLLATGLVFIGGPSLGQSDALLRTSIPKAPTKKALGVSSSFAAGFRGQERDGQHDFDFLFGSWAVHSRRLVHPLAGSNEWVDFDGTAVDKPIWDGRAQLEEFEADSPTGHIEGMTVRIYDSKSHQWSIYWANQSDGKFSLPATVGQFDGGRGEFLDQEDYKGKSILVRYTWIRSPDTPRWEQAFSSDGGKTWETNWVWALSRRKK